MRIGYVGLGAMGGALARHLVPKHTVTVFDLNASALAEFTALGARAASSCAELARDCEIVLLCLPRSSDVERVLFGPGGLAEGLAPGAIVVDQTSGVPDQTRAFARRLAEQGVAHDGRAGVRQPGRRAGRHDLDHRVRPARRVRQGAAGPQGHQPERDVLRRAGRQRPDDEDGQQPDERHYALRHAGTRGARPQAGPSARGA